MTIETKEQAKIRERCIVCERIIWRGGTYKDCINKHHIKREHRRDFEITCSQKCGKVFSRIARHIRNMNRIYKSKK